MYYDHLYNQFIWVQAINVMNRGTQYKLKHKNIHNRENWINTFPMTGDSLWHKVVISSGPSLKKYNQASVYSENRMKIFFFLKKGEFPPEMRTCIGCHPAVVKRPINCQVPESELFIFGMYHKSNYGLWNYETKRVLHLSTARARVM